MRHSFEISGLTALLLVFLGLMLPAAAREFSLSQARAIEKSYEIHLREEYRIRKSLSDALHSLPEAGEEKL